jgi:hypothetical protein
MAPPTPTIPVSSEPPWRTRSQPPSPIFSGSALFVPTPAFARSRFRPNLCHERRNSSRGTRLPPPS